MTLSIASSRIVFSPSLLLLLISPKKVMSFQNLFYQQGDEVPIVQIDRSFSFQLEGFDEDTFDESFTRVTELIEADIRMNCDQLVSPYNNKNNTETQMIINQEKIAIESVLCTPGQSTSARSILSHFVPLVRWINSPSFMISYSVISRQ